jgi:uncharacterized protein
VVPDPDRGDRGGGRERLAVGSTPNADRLKTQTRRLGRGALVLGLALLAASCGASGSSSSAAAPSATTTTDGGAAARPASLVGALDRLTPELPAATAGIPARWTSPAVDRAYLTAVFDDAQSVWRREFEASHLTWRRARLAMFWGETMSPCGHAEDSGPFYCPADSTLYLDLRFFSELSRRAGTSGAAQAYIVGHEIAHHVQRLLGIADRVAKADDADPKGKNARSVQVELQADCLSGVWGRSAYRRSKLTVRDLSEAVKEATVIGDDYIARAAGDVVDSSMWTHGSSQQRELWLRTGFESGRPSACDTFAGG